MKNDVFVTQDGGVYFTDDLDEIIEFYNKHKDHVELHGHLITQQHKCDEAFDELKRNDEKYTLEQVSFICAYITYAMEQFMEAQELTKLHHNARHGLSTQRHLSMQYNFAVTIFQKKISNIWDIMSESSYD